MRDPHHLPKLSVFDLALVDAIKREKIDANRTGKEPAAADQLLRMKTAAGLALLRPLSEACDADSKNHPAP
jgi:hypothetical protein